MSDDNQEDLYPCVGVCMSDPETGTCMGCGRPPLGEPEVAIEVIPPAPANTQASNDTPE